MGRTRISDLLATLFAWAANDDSRWRLPFDDSPAALLTILELVEDIERNAVSQGGHAMLVEASLATRQDVLAARQSRETLGDVDPVCDLLQFAATTWSLSGAIHRRDLNRADDWLAMSLCDDGTPGRVRTLTLGRIESLRRYTRHSDRALAEAATELALKWSESVLYGGWAASYWREVSSFTASTFESLLIASASQGDEIGARALCHLLSWYMRFEIQSGKAIVQTFERIASTLTGDLRVGASLVLAELPDGMPSRAPQDYAMEALAHLSPQSSAQLRLQVMRATCGGVAAELESHFDEIEGLVSASAGEIESAAGSDAILAAMGRGRMFSILGPLLRTLLANGRCELSERLVARWSGITTAPRLAGNVFIAAIEGGALCAVEGSVFGPPDGTTHSGGLTLATNAALGRTLVDSFYPSFELATPDRIGVPDHTHADEFKSAVEEYLPRDRLARLPKEVWREGAALVHLPGNAVPLQALNKSYGFPTLPILTSHQQPEADRAVTRVAIWQGEAQTASLEAELVSTILRAGGVDVHVVQPDSATRESFLAAYASSEADVFWIAAHGEYGHFEPEATALRLQHDWEERVTLLDLMSATPPRGHGRRLLVLNVCDGATFAELGGLQELGLGGVCTTASQAVMSHLWPIDFLGAAAFGALVAIGLVASRSFHGAFDYAIGALSGGRESVLWALSQVPKEAAEDLSARLERSGWPHDFLDKGSPAFMV